MSTVKPAGRFTEKICSTCGKDMVFVSVIDKVTKEWRPLEGMPLSGTLRKYQCQYCGNVETNEEA